MYNIYYLHEHCQDEIFKELNQVYLPLEKICKLDRFGQIQHNVVPDGDVSKLVDGDVIIPIDYQSNKLSYEDRSGITSISPLGEKVLEIVETVNKKITNHKKIFLLYTSTEPYYNENSCFIADLANAYKDCFFIMSGSGDVPNRYQHHVDKILACKNVSIIFKLWYFDRVHYIKEYSEYKDTPRHFVEYETSAPASVPSYITCGNKFMLTMRNPRPHRLIMSTLIEPHLDTIRYSRMWSLQSWWLDNIKENAEDEYQYQVNMLSVAIKEVLDDVDNDKFVNKMMHTIYGSPHILDMDGFQDKGHPPDWLYQNINIAIIASGEPNGWGYADEKQMIPMYYRVPFITFGSKGVYEEMEKIGFNVYRDVFDLSFSEQDSVFDRVEWCYLTIKEIDELDREDLIKLLDKCKPAIEKNYRHVKSGNFRHFSNGNFFEEMSHACS